MAPALLSLDLGTTRLKAAAFGLDGVLLYATEARHEDLRDPQGRYQNADAWWQLAQHCLQRVIDRLGEREVLGIGLSGRGAAAVLADASGAVVAHPWFDQRHAGYVDEVRAVSATPLPNVAVQFISKYLWARAHVSADIARAFYAKDWLLYKLTGQHMTDWSSGPDQAQWPHALDALRLPDDLLPAPRLPWQLAGTLLAPVARALGLPASTPVAVGAHDGLAANIGAGAVQHGDIVLTIGTHAIVRATMHSVPQGAHRFYSFPPHRHVIGSNALWAGRTADWLLDLLNHPAQGRFEAVEEAAADVAPGADGLRFAPFPGGQIAPVRRAEATAQFAGLSLGHGTAELYRAVLEGAAFAIRDIFNQVTGWSGPAETVHLTGGGSKSRLWTHILANVLQQPLQRSDGYVEARGAAMCTAVALGLFEDIDQAARQLAFHADTITPDPRTQAQYEALYGRWRDSAYG